MTQEESRSIDLEDSFFLYDHTSKQYILKLSPTILSIISKHDENDTRVIPVDDIYGCLCMKSKTTDNQCYLTFYFYGLKQSNRIFSTKLALHRSQETYVYARYNDYETNYAEIIRWHRQVTHAIYLRRKLPR
jgi:hypothetical protein